MTLAEKPPEATPFKMIMCTCSWIRSALLFPVFVLNDKLRCLWEKCSHFHLASSLLTQPNVTLTGRAVGCKAVILATGLQGERAGEAERGKMGWGDEENEGWRERGGSGSAFLPLTPPSALAPGWKTSLIDQSNC